ncbi:MAG TPA: ribbon-helix-helix protein, CopG family [Rhodanobacteraceae bacterium]|jgi:plasmid stability protein|nr:ribbon-helix-helix protein, CopG family [Rhodanobacteraceae bacterium]
MVKTMQPSTTRATIYLDTDLHKALRLKAADTHRSVSDIVSDAVRESLREDEEDLAVIAKRSKERAIGYAELLAILKANGKI